MELLLINFIVRCSLSKLTIIQDFPIDKSASSYHALKTLASTLFLKSQKCAVKLRHIYNE